MKCCINGGNVIRLLFLSAKLLKFEIQKSGQILCAHKPYFLMPGHIYRKLTNLSHLVFRGILHWSLVQYSHTKVSYINYCFMAYSTSYLTAPGF